VGTMSGGEKARLVLCMLVWQRPNLLLLDEPTNHLDLATREALSVALNEFEGTVMLVSHDRALLRSVCDEFWLVSRGGVSPFDGDLDDYQRYLLDEAKRQRELARETARAEDAAARPVAKAEKSVEPNAQSTRAIGGFASDNSASNRDQRRLDALARQQLADRIKPLKRELERSEHAMANLNQEKAALESRLGQPISQAEMAEAGKRMKAIHDSITSIEERWLALSEQIEQAEAAA
ncbi:MAG TPA: ATP-binding cassette domain-containing protein, partial [Burkholderiaceae bacterium]|nr:ATP-binding cassette domain-containing protein [Burkholderiaceae bacterium]